MPFTLLQVGGSLKSINGSGGLSSALTLPTGIALATNRIPRFARFKQYAIVVNTPSRPISVDEDGIVRPLTPLPPTAAVALTGPNAGTLSGTYLSVQTYAIKDTLGNIIAESDYGPLMSAAVTIASKKLLATYAVSTEDAVGLVTRLFRTVTNGGEYFSWADSSNNTSTTIENDTADDALGVVEAPSRGSAPDLTLIAEWGGRLWGVDRTDIDDLRYTEAGTAYAWAALNTLPIPHLGSDAAGITALTPRRAALGVARLDVFQQVTGSQRSNFNPVVVNGGEKVGVVSQDSVVVFNDVAYFLWRDGVYKWDGNGISSITNGAVRSWFTSDAYFNRAMYWRAFGQLDPTTLKYRLFLASLGSAQIDRWIEYDLLTGTWWGPHKTDAFNPTCAILVAGNNQQPYYMIGSKEGYLSQDQSEKNDWGVSPVALDVTTHEQDMDDPENEKYFGELSVHVKAQTVGTLTVTPTVGDLGATASTPFAMDMSLGRERLGRIGTGKHMSLRFAHATLNQDVAIYGYEVDPAHVVGRR